MLRAGFWFPHHPAAMTSAKSPVTAAWHAKRKPLERMAARKARIESRSSRAGAASGAFRRESRSKRPKLRTRTSAIDA